MTSTPFIHMPIPSARAQFFKEFLEGSISSLHFTGFLKDQTKRIGYFVELKTIFYYESGRAITKRAL